MLRATSLLLDVHVPQHSSLRTLNWQSEVSSFRISPSTNLLSCSLLLMTKLLTMFMGIVGWCLVLYYSTLCLYTILQFALTLRICGAPILHMLQIHRSSLQSWKSVGKLPNTNPSVQTREWIDIIIGVDVCIAIEWWNHFSLWKMGEMFMYVSVCNGDGNHLD